MWTRIAVVAVGGAMGAAARYAISGWVMRYFKGPLFPLGTLGVNVAGAFLLGLLMGATTSGRWLAPPVLRIWIGVGILGGFTTFSTFTYETVEAIRLGNARVALANVFLSLVCGIGACWLGLLLGDRL
jgi:CrcB protein